MGSVGNLLSSPIEWRTEPAPAPAMAPQTNWQNQARRATASSAARAPTRGAARQQPAPAPEVNLIDWDAEEATTTTEAAVPQNIFDPLAGASSPGDGDDGTGYQVFESADGGLLALNSDLASLSWGDEPAQQQQQEEEDDYGLSVEGEASGSCSLAEGSKCGRAPRCRGARACSTASHCSSSGRGAALAPRRV